MADYTQLTPSILSSDQITEIIRVFYRRVWEDEEAPWFSGRFRELVPEQHAVVAQAAMWDDTLSGKRNGRPSDGIKYYGGERRTHFHHYRAKGIMTERGAARWSYHMRGALDEVLPRQFPDDAERVKVRGALDTFLLDHMALYEEQFSFVAPPLDTTGLEPHLSPPLSPRPSPPSSSGQSLSERLSKMRISRRKPKQEEGDDDKVVSTK